jgi:hypothetical protein
MECVFEFLGTNRWSFMNCKGQRHLHVLNHGGRRDSLVKYKVEICPRAIAATLRKSRSGIALDGAINRPTLPVMIGEAMKSLRRKKGLGSPWWWGYAVAVVGPLIAAFARWAL